MFANVVFAVAAVGVLATAGESHALLTTAAVIGAGALAVAIALFAIALHDDGNARLVGGFAERLWNWLARLCAARRRRAGTSGSSASAARPSACCSAAGSRSPLATLAGHLTVFLVLLVSLRTVGVRATR